MTALGKSVAGDREIAVIGAGIVGLSVAWSLVKRGWSVTIFDPNPPGSGCSSGSAGSISNGSVVPLAMPGTLARVPGMLLNQTSPLHIPLRYWKYALPWLMSFIAAARPGRVREIASTLAPLYAPAVEEHMRLLREIGATDLIRTTGQIHLYRNDRHLHQNSSEWDLRSRHGIEYEVLDRSGIEALEPDVGPAYQTGVYIPSSGMSVNPLRHAETIAGALRQSGAKFARERVVGFQYRDGAVVGLRTTGGEIASERIIVSAGAWSAGLLETIGYQVPLETQRGYHIDYADTGISLSRPVVAADRKVFFTPVEIGLRVAGTVEIGGLKAPPNEKRAQQLGKHLEKVLPKARVANPMPYWMGHRPCLPDSMPVIGESERCPGLFFAFGHGHLGLTASAVTGELIASLVNGEQPAIDIAPFNIERFDR